MNRLGKIALAAVAMLLAAAVAYDDPVSPTSSSAPPAGPTAAPTPSASPTPTDTPTAVPTPSATSTPTDTPTAAPNSAPTLEVLQFSGIRVSPNPKRSVFRVFLSGARSREIPIRLRARDVDGNLRYMALIDDDGVILDQANCEADMARECTLVLTMNSPDDYDRIIRFHGVAVDGEGARSEESRLVLSSAPSPDTPTPTPEPTPTPQPTPTVPPSKTVSMTVPAGEEAVVEHESGARIEIPNGATVPVPTDWSAGPELTSIPQRESDEMVTVSITEFETPVPNVVEVQSAYDISIVDEDGEDVVLREPVTVTLPFTMPEGKNAADVLVVHWNEHLERWESVEGGVVDEAAETVTVEMDHLTGVGVTLFVDPVRLLAMVEAAFAGVDVIGEDYDAGYKHAITLHGDATLTIPVVFVGVEVGASLVLDVDDILSLGKEAGEGYTVEGESGFFTYGQYMHFALEPPAKEFSTGLTVTMPYMGKYSGQFGPQGYNNDLSFESSFSLLSVDLPLGQYPGFPVKISTPGTHPSLELLTFNSNGNFSPVNAQMDKCADCIFSLGVSAGAGSETFGVDIEALSTSLVVASGEFNTNFSDIVQNLMQGQCGQSRCKITWSEFIDLTMKGMAQDYLGVVYTLGEKIGLLYEYTAYENLNPEDVADIGWGYANGVKDVSGGHDVNDDGKGDMVFPSGSSDGALLQVWTTGDKTENQRHFLELVSVSGGWSVESDVGSWHTDLNAEEKDPSDDALLRVDYDASALSLNETRWLVTATTTAPNSGSITFRLRHNRTGRADEQLDEVILTLWKDKQFSDLSIQAQVDP